MVLVCEEEREGDGEEISFLVVVDCDLNLGLFFFSLLLWA